MTPRSFFKIIIKIFGIFFIWEFIAFLPQFISSFLFFKASDFAGDEIMPIIITLAVLALYFGLISLLLFRTDSILDKLKLDKGFSEEHFTFNWSSFQLISAAVIVGGALLLIQEIPTLCKTVYGYIQQRALTRRMFEQDGGPSAAPIIISIVKIVIALLLIGERKRIVGFIEDRQRKVPEEEEN